MNRITIFIASFIFLALLSSPAYSLFNVNAQEADTASEESSETTDEEVTAEPSLELPDELPGVGLRLTLSPTFVNLVTDPGQPITSTIKIKNNNNVREYLTFDFAQYETVDGGENLSLAVLDEDAEFRDWVTFEETEFILDPSEVRTIEFTISPPEDASLGYYYAILIKRIQEKEFGQTGTSITGIPAFAVLLEVRDPNAKRELQLVDFKTDKFFYEYLPTEFNISVRNTGNIHLIPSGDIFIDWAGQKDYVILRANPQRGNIIPGQERILTTTWDDGFIVRQPVLDEDGEIVRDDEGNPKLETKWDFTKADKFRIGKYTANLVMIYDNGQRDIPIEGTVSFWVIPWKILIAIALISILALAGLKDAIIGFIKKVTGRTQSSKSKKS